MSTLNFIDKAALRDLCRPDNAVALRHLFYRIAGETILFAATIMLFENWLPISLLLFYACAIWHGFWGYAGIGHELYHSRVFSNSGINSLLYRLASYLTWNNPEFFRVSHNFHHRNTFAADDSEALSTQDWSPLSIMFYLLADLPLAYRRLMYAVINAAGFTFRQGELDRIGGRYQLESILMVSFHGLVHIGFWVSFHTWQFNAMWFLLPFTGQFFNRLLAQSQHVGLADFKNEGPLTHSRTVPLPKFVEFLYAGMNFHVEHHLVSVVPYYKLPQLNALLAERKLLKRVSAAQFFCKEIWQALRESRGSNMQT